jgi:hypothetical protein
MGASVTDATFAQIAPGLDPAALAAALHARWHDLDTSTPIETLHQVFRNNADPSWVAAVREHVTDVPAEYRLVEGVAFDEARSRLFAGTVIDGRLAYIDDYWKSDRADAWHEIPIGNPRGGLFGMAIDKPRQLLWIATGSVEQTAVQGERMAGLIAVDLRTLAVVRRIPLAPGTPGLAGDVAVARDGTVYASNPVSGAIHRCRPGCTVLDDLVPPGRFANPQGMALLGRGKRLFVADYASGLWRVDRASGEARPVEVKEPVMLDGIDGLYAVGEDELFAVQNGTHPRRVIRLWIGRGRAIVRPSWVIFTPDEGEATLGALAGAGPGGGLIFVADGQWERYGPGGVVKDGAPLRPTPIDSTHPQDILVN